MRLARTVALLALLAPALAAATPVADRKSLTLAGARTVIAAALGEARRLGTTGVVAVVDEGGNLVAVERTDGTFPAGARISIGKARTAALFRKPTRAFEEIIGKGRTAMVALEDFTPLQGGVPLTVDGQVVGAVGVSGASSAQQDEELALAGAAALSGATGPVGDASVRFIPGERVAAAFARGAPLLEVAGYKVHASHRAGPGEAEVHTRDTDVIHVLRGSATIVTGGRVLAPRDAGPEELRGAAIEGGEVLAVAEGDVLVVPNGVPHWFRDVPAPLDYYVVKVRAEVTP